MMSIGDSKMLRKLPLLLLLLLLVVGCTSSPPREPTGPQCRAGLKLYCENRGGDETCICVSTRQQQEVLDDLYNENGW